MKAKFATWYLLTLMIGYFSETFSKSLTSDKDNTTESFESLTLIWTNYESSENTKTPTLNGIPSEPLNLTRITTDNKKSWKSKEAQRNEEQSINVTNRRNVKQRNKFQSINVTNRRNVKQRNKFQSKLSRFGDYVFGSLVLGTCILSLLGNGSALTIFRFRQRRLIPIEIFFINLAITNLLLSVASYPLSIISSFKHGWSFGELGCTVYGFCCYFLGLSSIYIITAMAYTRYLITCKSVHGNQITCWTCCKMAAAGYLLAFLWALFPLLGLGKYEIEPFGFSCTLDWIAKDMASRVYIVLVTIFCVFLPLIILVFCYAQIIMLVKHSNAVMKNSRANKRNREGSSDQLTWISWLISTGFVIAWFPYTIACLSASFQGEVVLPIWLTPGPSLFAKSFIVYNPIIYIFTTERYRKDFYDLTQYISCKKKCVRERERRKTIKILTATDKDGSNSQSGIPITCEDRIEEDSVGISNGYVAVSLKETWV